MGLMGDPMAQTVLYRLVAYRRDHLVRLRFRVPGVMALAAARGLWSALSAGAGKRCPRHPTVPGRAWVLALALLPMAAAAAERLLIVTSGSTASRQEALTGIRSAGVPVTTLDSTTGSDAAIDAAIAQVGRDEAIVTLGARADARVARLAPAVPVVNCMVIGGDDRNATPATVVVPLEVPVDAQVPWLRRLLPDVRKVGILFDPARSERQAAADAAALKRAGYEALLEGVAEPTELPGALSRLAGKVDLLYAIPDSMVFAREHSRALLLFSFRHRIPLAGPAESWVRSGALYAIEWDYEDLGRYCAALALRQRSGGRAPPPPTARTRVVVNVRTAEQLDIRWDAEILRTVDKVYR